MKKNLIRIAIYSIAVVFPLTVNAQWIQTNGPVGENIVALALCNGTIFAGAYDAGVFLSTNNGSSWSAADSGLTNDSIGSLAVIGSNIFVGTVGVFRTTNNGTSWMAVDSGLPVSTAVYALAVSGGTMFAGTHDGVFLSANNGTSWTPVNSGLTNILVNCLAVSGGNIFAGTYGGVFRSPDDGASWTAVNSGLANDTITDLAVSNGNIFAGLWRSGVFLSTNNGTSWTEVNSGLPANTTVLYFAASGANIFTGTIDKGVWRRPISEMVGVVYPKSQRKVLTFNIHSSSHTNPDVTIEFSLLRSDQVTIKIYDLSGHEIATLAKKLFGSGSYALRWSTRTIASGCYTVRMQAGLNTYARSIPIFR